MHLALLTFIWDFRGKIEQNEDSLKEDVVL
jgi:hypothetical protein